jgi:hypothetical protein
MGFDGPRIPLRIGGFDGSLFLFLLFLCLGERVGGLRVIGALKKKAERKCQKVRTMILLQPNNEYTFEVT